MASVPRFCLAIIPDFENRHLLGKFDLLITARNDEPGDRHWQYTNKTGMV